MQVSGPSNRACWLRMGQSAHDRAPGNPLTVDAELGHLAQLRAHVGSLAEASGASDDIVESFKLVVSELATNVMQHSDAPRVTVAFERFDNDWVVDVSDADFLDDLGTGELPDPAELAGRGLFLVHAVMDAVALIDIEGRRHIRCLKSAG